VLLCYWGRLEQAHIRVPFGGIGLVDCDYYYLLVETIVGCYDMNKAALVTSLDQATWVWCVIGIFFNYLSCIQSISNFFCAVFSLEHPLDSVKTIFLLSRKLWQYQ